ncbi:MAG: tryptophan synthase subunit alpha [Solobacterium sp.]|nr:tryptophan synthase subunit alpha [Solobacterium sp.]
MSRIQEAFQNHKAFIPFVTCGDPDLETTKKVIRAMAEAGADLIELGIPFSDPTAEGPVIMDADERALKSGVTTDLIFSMTKELRETITIPFVYMTYANVVFSYGTERFMKQASEAGIDGLILPDVPYEEKEDFAGIAAQYGIDLISMIAPTSKERIARIAKDAKGFLYIVSSLGVTGVRSAITTDIGAMVNLVREYTSIPCAVGFGISTPEQAEKMASLSDGAIVGSAIVRLIAEHGTDSAEPVREYVKSMADAVHAIRD